jgi:hypothetical protein
LCVYTTDNGKSQWGKPVETVANERETRFVNSRGSLSLLNQGAFGEKFLKKCDFGAGGADAANNQLQSTE